MNFEYHKHRNHYSPLDQDKLDLIEEIGDQLEYANDHLDDIGSSLSRIAAALEKIAGIEPAPVEPDTSTGD